MLYSLTEALDAGLLISREHLKIMGWTRIVDKKSLKQIVLLPGTKYFPELRRFWLSECHPRECINFLKDLNRRHKVLAVETVESVVNFAERASMVDQAAQENSSTYEHMNQLEYLKTLPDEPLPAPSHRKYQICIECQREKTISHGFAPRDDICRKCRSRMLRKTNAAVKKRAIGEAAGRAGELSKSHKRCKGCKAIKPRSEFYQDKRNADLLALKCKECVKTQRERNKTPEMEW